MPKNIVDQRQKEITRFARQEAAQLIVNFGAYLGLQRADHLPEEFRTRIRINEEKRAR